MSSLTYAQRFSLTNNVRYGSILSLANLFNQLGTHFQHTWTQHAEYRRPFSSESPLASNICFLTLARLNMGTHQIIWRLVSSGDIAMAPMKLSKSQKVRWTTWMDFSTWQIARCSPAVVLALNHFQTDNAMGLDVEHRCSKNLNFMALGEGHETFMKHVPGTFTVGPFSSTGK